MNGPACTISADVIVAPDSDSDFRLSHGVAASVVASIEHTNHLTPPNTTINAEIAENATPESALRNYM